MTPYVYLKSIDKPTITRVCARAGITYGYFRQVAHGHRELSAEAAVALEEATRHEAKNSLEVITAVEALRLDARLTERMLTMRKRGVYVD